MLQLITQCLSGQPSFDIFSYLCTRDKVVIDWKQCIDVCASLLISFLSYHNDLCDYYNYHEMADKGCVCLFVCSFLILRLFGFSLFIFLF